MILFPAHVVLAHVAPQQKPFDFDSLPPDALGPLPGYSWNAAALLGRDLISRRRIDEVAREMGIALRWREAVLDGEDLWRAGVDGGVAARLNARLSEDEDLAANAILIPPLPPRWVFSLARGAFRPAVPVDVRTVALPDARLQRLLPIALRPARVARLTSRYGAPRLAAAAFRRGGGDADFFLVFPEGGPAPVYYRVQVLAGAPHYAGRVLELPCAWEPEPRQQVF